MWNRRLKPLSRLVSQTNTLPVGLNRISWKQHLKFCAIAPDIAIARQRKQTPQTNRSGEFLYGL
ncbi:hypothetical protein [Roseofilum casamattae]|uniref:Transposase n=1 Tax=Roseofilum casamattae BLCC-M143 TaxID=3022442 RepID=A0ABT7BVA1_9CYAN|nr:hypothetical protein [Roseofilum casamattae]MDJ1183122.1 hypothetical protein [Roseofilum casamattae BLCC-M143]